MVEQVTNKWINDYVVFTGKDKFSIVKSGLAPEAGSDENLVRLLSKQSVGFTRKHVCEIILNASRTSGSFLLPGDWKYVCKKDVLEFSHKSSTRSTKDFSYRLAEKKDVICKEKNWVVHLSTLKKKKSTPIDLKDPLKAFFDASKCAEPLEFRSVEKGDRFWPSGAQRDVDCTDFLKKQGVPAEERKAWGVVACGSGEIAWVAGLRTGHRFRVTAATKDILQISCKPKT
jgi:hypothetical protein